MKICDCKKYDCERCQFMERVLAAKYVKKIKNKKDLHCTKCNASMGVVRTGKGRQRELCEICFTENRRENGKKQDAKRREQRRSEKE